MAAGLDIDKKALWDKVGYLPHEKQLLFHDSPSRFKVPVCGRRFGKSKMAAMEALPSLFQPNTVGWIVGPTYTLGAKEFDYMWDAVMMRLRLGPHLKRKAYNLNTGDMYIEMPWNSRVDVKSADHPEGLVSEGLDWVIVTEAAKQKQTVWDRFLRPSLADKHGWAAFPSTPEGHNWYYDLYRRGKEFDPEYNPNYEAWNFPSWENPYVYPGGFDDPEIQDMLRSPDDPWFWQEIGADFRSFVGKIYTEWDDKVHILRDYEYNPEWDNYMFFDFGFENPFVALDVQISPSEDIYIWREYYVKNLPIHMHAQHLKDRSNPDEYAIRAGFGDAADPGAIETLSMMLVGTYGDSEAKKDVTRGIQEVKRFLKDKTGTPHLFVSRDCPNTIWEFQNYRFKQTTKGEENFPDAPKKWADHALDALRYGLMSLFALGSRYHLSDVVGTVPSSSPSHSGQGDVPAQVGGGSFFTQGGESTFVLGGSREF